MVISSDMAEETNPNPSWYTAKRLLALFCIINMLNYIDRGVIASNGVNGSLRTCTEGGTCSGGSGIQGDFNLNYFEDGLLSSFFMVGLLVASPIFASLAKIHNPFRLIGVGLSVWTFATAGCGCSFNFWSIAIFRMLVGVGEASFISLAAPFIDDNAPPDQKTAWLSIFYMCIPTGIAIGYIYGGVVGNFLNWRVAFWGEAVLMLPFAVFGFVSQPLKLKGFGSFNKLNDLSSAMEINHTDCEDVQCLDDNDCLLSEVPESEAENINEHAEVNVKKKQSLLGRLEPLHEQLKGVWNDLKILLVDYVYVVNVLGYIAYNFVIGAYSYWGPKAGYDIYNMTDADLVFGGITIVCGIFGTIGGGFVLDYVGSSIRNAFKLLGGATFLGGAFCFSAFLSKKLYGFIPLFAAGELLIFATQGPVNYVALHCVTPSLRPLAMAMCTVSIHIFGDVPSSPLVGVLQDYVQNWRETSLILTSILFLSAAIWFIGVFLHSVDKSEEDSKATGK
uniref:Major facilitator superfamily (MFS) profile domain-containing protein n=1 Tax=Araucaria cunninghamii TaxID=56994 RepID=A0A0D6R0A4_ARACU